MKQKLLNSIRLRAMMLVAVMCAAFAGQAWGETASFTYSDFKGQGTSGSGSALTGATKGDVTITGKGYGNTSYLQVYGSNYLVVTPNSGATITKVVITASSSSYIKTWSASDKSSVAVSGSTATWSGSSTSAITLTNTAGSQARVTSIEVTYTPAAPAYTITAVSNNDSYGTVSLSGTTITATPEDGYRVVAGAGGYTVTGTATVTNNGDNTFSVTPSSDCTVQINFEAIPTHTATFSINGNTENTADFAEGADINFPVDPEDINGKTFVGWVAEAITGSTDTEPSFVTSATMSTSDVIYYAVFATVGESSTTKTDNITLAATGVSGNSYDSWSGLDLTSSAVYSGCNAGGNSAIQLNGSTNTSKRGIISTSSGGTLSKVTITWNSNTTNDRSITVYGSNSAYTTMSAFNESKGTELGSITKGSSTELTVTGSYKYVGFYATSAIYIDEISIDWSVSEVSYSAYCTTVSALPVPTITFKDGEDAITTLNANSLNAFIPVSVTCSAGDVTLSFESSNDEVAEYDEGNVLTYAEGTATITATFAGNGSFQGTSATLTVNVERAKTTLSFPATPATINIGESATYAATGSPSVSGITYSSSNTSALTVNSATGEITGVAKGSATITASFAGNDNYKPTSKSYTILVVNPNEITYTLTNSQIVSGGPDEADGYGDKAITDANGKTWNAYAIKNYHSKATSGYHYLQIKVYDNTTASYIQVPAYGTRITELQMTVSGSSKTIDGGGNGATIFFSADNTTKTTGPDVASGTGSSTVTIDCSALNLNTGYITASGSVRIWDVKVTYEYALPIGSALWTSHVTADAVDFTGVTAYIAKTVNAETISLKEITSAPANTPVIIKGDAQKTYYLQTKYSSLDDVSSNLLQASDGSVTGDGSTIYALGKKDDVVGFYLVGDDVAIPAGKAYITIPTSVKEFLTFDFDDATAVSEVKNEGVNSEKSIFNLAGQKMSKLQKGVNIVNGKKVLVK